MSHSLGATLRQIRTEKDISVTDLARTVGVSREHVTRIESGQSQPSLALVKHLALVLEVPPSVLLNSLDEEVDDDDGSAERNTRPQRRSG